MLIRRILGGRPRPRPSAEPSELVDRGEVAGASATTPLEVHLERRLTDGARPRRTIV